MGLYGDMHNGGQQAMNVWPGRRSEDTYANAAAPVTKHLLSATAEKDTVLLYRAHHSGVAGGPAPVIAKPIFMVLWWKIVSCLYVPGIVLSVARFKDRKEI